jgi:MFS family permease
VLVLGIPESPRWLIARKNDLAGAKKVLERLGAGNTDEIISAVKTSLQHESSTRRASGFFNRKYKTVLGLAFMIAFFNQWSGINFILYYAPEILERAGLAAKESLFNSIAIGETNLIFTFVGLYFIDRAGRKTLLIIGSLGYIVSLAMVAWCFYVHANAGLLLVFLLIFIASHAIGQGAVIWVFIAEIFPNRVRALGQSFGASTHWVFAALITLITPVFLDKDKGILRDAPWIIFAFFAFMMVLQLVWVLTKMPETKGVSLENLGIKLIRQ